MIVEEAHSLLRTMNNPFILSPFRSHFKLLVHTQRILSKYKLHSRNLKFVSSNGSFFMFSFMLNIIVEQENLLRLGYANIIDFIHQVIGPSEGW